MNIIILPNISLTTRTCDNIVKSLKQTIKTAIIIFSVVTIKLEEIKQNNRK